LDKCKLGSQLRQQFDGKKRPDHFKPALFMTVRRNSGPAIAAEVFMNNAG